VWGVRPPSEGVEAFLGKRVHESLESLYESVSSGAPAPELGEVLERFDREWERQWSGSIRIVQDRQPEYYRQIGVACLTHYYRKHDPFDAGTTIAVEQSFEFLIEEDSPHTVRGFIDRFDIGPDGTLEVHDYKTGKRAQDVRALAADNQVGFYEMAARRLFPNRREVRLVWHYLQVGVERHVPPRDPGALTLLRRRTRRRIDEAERRITDYHGGLDAEARLALAAAETEPQLAVPEAARRFSRHFPTRVSPLCRWCEFLPWCRDGSQKAGVQYDPPPLPPARPAGSSPVQPRLF